MMEKILKMTFALILATISVCQTIILAVVIMLAVIISFSNGYYFVNFLVGVLIIITIIFRAKDIYDDLE